MQNQSKDIRIFLVDDDSALLTAMSQSFELDDIEVAAISDPTQLFEHVSRDLPGIVVTDVRMPGMDGFEVFEKVKKVDAEIPVIFVTGHADVPMVLNTLRNGAFDFYTKPIDTELLLASVRRAMDTRRLVLENRELRALAEQAIDESQLIGESDVMCRLRETALQVATTNVDVLIEGESGTGKSVLAAQIHKLSGRRADRFVRVNCAALPAAIVDETLFGAAGDYGSESLNDRIGQIEASDTGTLYLDDIKCIPHSAQGRLLQVLEDRQVMKMGAQEPKAIDLRVIVSSNSDLPHDPATQTIQPNLLYQLSTIKLLVPPLRERKEDIPLMFARFLQESAKRFDKKVPNVSVKTRRRLIDYDWPGNVRELKSFADSVVIGVENSTEPNSTIRMALPARMERFESNTIRSALESTGGDVRSTLELLGIPRKTFYDKVSRHGIDLKQYRKKGKT